MKIQSKLLLLLVFFNFSYLAKVQKVKLKDVDAKKEVNNNKKSNPVWTAFLFYKS